MKGNKLVSTKELEEMCSYIRFFLNSSLYPKFATPWASYLTTTSQTEPNYHLPSCYNVAPPPPNPKKAAQFSDETLFFSFYAMPRDAAQEVAAQEL